MFIKRHMLCNEEPGGEGGQGGGADPTPPSVMDDNGGTPPAPTGDPTPPAPADTNYFADVPEDWRTQLAGGDDKRLTQLERMPTFDKFTESFWNAQDKIRKGELSSGLPENPTDQQLAEWRTANDVPESPADYKISLEEGLVLGEEDERIMGPVMEVFHAGNVPNAVVSAATTAMLKGREVEQQAILAKDEQDKINTSSALKAAWDNDYQANLNVVKGMVAKMPSAIREDFYSARLPNGQALFNSPEFLVWAADTGRTLDPHSTVVPNSTNPMQSIDAEIKELEGKMGTDEWHKDKESQARYLKLLDAKERMG